MRTSNLPLTLITIVVAVMAGMEVAYAATPSPDQGIKRTASQMNHEGFGVLKAVNMEAGKVQLAHEAISSLHWPAMTMWFVLQSPFPSKVKVGDNVRFVLEQTRSEEWVITRIERKR